MTFNAGLIAWDMHEASIVGLAAELVGALGLGTEQRGTGGEEVRVAE
ncbi:MAG: hypothetical protein WA997_02815 [Anaerolineales bacterium]